MPARLTLIAFMAALSLSACSTVAGLGEDLQNAGPVLKSESRKAAAGS